MNTFSGRLFVDGAAYDGSASLNAVVIGYEPIPAEERIPIVGSSPNEVRLNKAMLLEDEKQQRVDIEYRLSCLREVSRVDGPPCAYAGKTSGRRTNVVTGQQYETTASFYGPVTVPEPGQGSVHYVAFVLTRAGRAPVQSADLAKLDQGEVKGLGLHFVAKED